MYFLNSKLKRNALALLVCMVVVTANAYTQSTRATIVGTVRDPSGAVLPGVTVTVKNTGTGLVRTIVTNDSGDYTVPLLPIGSYEVSCELAGFKIQVRSGITLQVDDRVRIDLSMEIGQITDKVIVTGSAPLVQSENASIGNVIDHTKIVDLPLDGREFYSLARLNPAVYAPSQGSTVGYRGGFNVAGASEIANSYSLDGIENMDASANQPAHRPSIDTIQEFKVLTGTYSAEYGRYGGGQVIVTTKSGTNELHGTAYNFYRNSAMDARNFFAATLDPFTRNQFGGTLGGPILRDRTHFFVGYEGLRMNEQVTTLTTVPSEAMRSGDLSELLNASNPFTNRITRITDPKTGQPFANNVIPGARIDRVGRLLSDTWYPSPNLTGARNYRSTGDRTLSGDQFSVRIDHRMNDKNNLSVGYQFQDLTPYEPMGSIPLCGSRVLPGHGCEDPSRTQTMFLSDLHIFSPNLIHEFRIGFTRLGNWRNNVSGDKGIAQRLAIPGLPAAEYPYNQGGPQVSVSGFATIGPASNNPQGRWDNTGNLIDSLSYTRGTHGIKLGMDVRLFQFNSFFPGNRGGVFTFNGFLTGYSFADLLLGSPRTAAVTTGHPWTVTTDTSYNLFFQDDWKVSNRLTLNLGVRWEYNGPVIERNDWSAAFDPATNRLRLPRGGECYVDASGQLVIKTGNGDSRSVWDADKNNFAPRIGVAYRPFSSNRFVIRAGYGVFYTLTPSGNGLSGLWRGLPYQVATSVTSSTTNPVLLSDPFTPGPGRALARFQHPGLKRLLLTPYFQQYTLGIQREISSNLMIEAAYQGSQGTKLLDASALNQPTPGPGSIDARRPYQPWGNISFTDNIGRSWYNGLQIKVERRMSHGISGLISYTYGKSLDTGAFLGSGGDGNVSAQDPQNYRLNKGLSSFDVRHRFVVSYVIELPFGKGRRFMDSVSRPMDMILGGWQISGILTLQSGPPFSPRISTDNSNTGTTNRPNLIGDWRVDKPTPEQWFNKDAFCFSVSCGLAQYTYGDAGRNILIGPGTANLDFSLMKNFAVHEDHRLQFRGEFFNLTNHPNFFLPDGTVNLGTGGTISQANKGRTVQVALKYLF